MKKIANWIFRQIKRTQTDAIADLINETHANSYLEVGVFEGTNILRLIKKFPELNITAVDPWSYEVVKDYTRGRGDQTKDQGKYEQMYLKFKEQVSTKKVEVIRKTSMEASKLIKAQEYAVIFIDARHDRKSVEEDIKAWLPKVKKGGYLCGHDYDVQHFGVIEAVNSVLGTDNVRIGSGTVWIYKK